MKGVKMSEFLIGFLLIASLAFFVGIIITRWVFRIDEIIRQLKKIEKNTKPQKEKFEN